MIYSNVEQKIYVEHYDDLAIKNRDKLKIIQTKSSGTSKKITNSSIEFWKTLRNWSKLVIDKEVDLANSQFLIILTNEVSSESAAFYLKPDVNKPSYALESLLNFIKTTKDSDIKNKFFPIFERLGYRKQIMLLDKISVLDNAPTTKQIEERIKYFLRKNFEAKYIEEYYIKIRGWWEVELEKILDSKEVKVISSSAINPLINSMVENHQKDIYLKQVLTPQLKSKISKETNDRTYVKQLKIIDKGSDVIKSAKTDYVLTHAANSSLVDENPHNDERITGFKKLLRGEWKVKFDIEKGQIPKNVSREKLVSVGSKIHEWAMLGTNLNFSKEPTPYYTRGTFHDLADEEKVGWHPDYKKELKSLS